MPETNEGERQCEICRESHGYAEKAQTTNPHFRASGFHGRKAKAEDIAG